MADPIRSYLAECFWPGVTKAQLEELDSRDELAPPTGHDGTAQVRYRGSMLMPEDEVVFCFLVKGDTREGKRSVARMHKPSLGLIVAATCVALLLAAAPA